MRWSGQELTTDDPGVLPGLKLSNLVRSVTTPEFADMRFHEVMSKSALNHVPGDSAMPFNWTINPYRGCSHACTFCLGAETLILMADGTQKPLRDVRAGDEVYGTEMRGRYRRYVKTKVLAHWQTRKPAHLVSLADGTRIIASGEHRFLTDRGWKHVTGAGSGVGARPHLTTNNSLVGFGTTGLDGLDRAITSTADLRVTTVEALGRDEDMYDITTGTGDFIANGVVSHNCFARNTHTYLDLDAGKDFDSEIVVKVNVAEVLARELAKPSWKHEAVALGTNTDPYQRAEGRYRLMPGIIAALTHSGTPFSILTKGTLVRRDLPLLAEAGEHVAVDLAMTIAVHDDELQRSVEPGAPATKGRLDTVRAIREAGLDCTVFMMPILPYLTDSRAHLEEAVRAVKAAGGSSIMYSALHLRPGAREWFMEWLQREHPELVPRYLAMYGRSAYAPKEYRQWLAAKIKPIIQRHGLERGIMNATTRTLRTPRTGSLIAEELPPGAAQPTLF